MHLAEPLIPLVRYRGQDSDFDDLMKVPIKRFGSMDDLVFDTSAPARYIVLDARFSLPVDLLFVPRDSDGLFVGFHGAENRSQADLPKFQFVRSFMTRQESLLFVSDTTLLQGDKINIGWLAGNKDTPLADLISEAVRRAGDALRVRRTVLLGHSAGGFSAVLVGSRVPNSRAISINGQTVIERYEQWTVDNLLKYAFPECLGQTEMIERYGNRLDLRLVLQHRLPSSSFTHFGSRRDQASFGRMPHFSLLAEHFGLDDEGGITGHGDALVPADWETPSDSGHALPASMMPFIHVTLDECPAAGITHTVDPSWHC